MFFCPIRHSIGIQEMDFEGIFYASFFFLVLSHPAALCEMCIICHSYGKLQMQRHLSSFKKKINCSITSNSKINVKTKKKCDTIQKGNPEWSHRAPNYTTLKKHSFNKHPVF